MRSMASTAHRFSPRRLRVIGVIVVILLSSGVKSQKWQSDEKREQWENSYWNHPNRVDRTLDGKSALSRQSGSVLNSPCSSASDCNFKLPYSFCDKKEKRCKCRRHFYNYRNQECLPGQLLTFPCKLDAQCQGRVASSMCVGGRCQCRRGTVPFRRHTCAPGARVTQICYSDEQCHLEDASTFCKFILRNVFGRCECLFGKDEQSGQCKQKFTELGQKCFQPGSCEGLTNAECVPKDHNAAYCQCKPGYKAISSTKCIKKPLLKANLALSVSLGYPCQFDHQCQTSDIRSVCSSTEERERAKGICVCNSTRADGFGEAPRTILRGGGRRNRVKRRSPRWFCNPRRLRLCPEGTFQCLSDGNCISRYFVCNGRVDCSDGSDEDCDRPHNCPQGAFECPISGKCISTSKVCNGKPDCPQSEDEEHCVPNNNTLSALSRQLFTGKLSAPLNCPASSFECLDGSRCVPGFELCNSQIACPDASDESSALCNSSPLKRRNSKFCPFRCANGNCRALEVMCSGKDGCGDNSDEDSCHICKCPP